MAQPEIDRHYNRFTQSARDVFIRANDVSTRFGQNYIDTPDIFLGIVNGPENDPALRVLNGLGVDVNKARSAVELLMVHGQRSRDIVGLTERAKTVIELAREEADRLHSHPVTSVHLLLGTVRNEEGVVAGVLKSLGVSIDKTRAEAEKLEAERMVEEPKRKIETEDYQKATPPVRNLIKLHHPDWSPDRIEELTPTVTHAIVDFLYEVLNLPEDPNQREPLYQKASDRFNSRFFPTPEVE